ncbi:unnamed protein product [Linum trigynum]|uniref:DEAD-box ATP-dependent RNA helicase 33 n=1 Tax=Linum trigynum TaxID=586398 RepID=A0AAV2FN41_9ROSI
MAMSILPPHLSFSKTLTSESPLFLSKFSHLSIQPKPVPRKSTVIRMGGGPRTYPGGVSRWQWKRMQAKKSKQLLKARLSRERQIYEMRKRAELKAAVAELERPWEVVNKAPTLFSVGADEQVKVLADRFQKPGGFDLWTERDGPQLFKTPDGGIPSARFFPKGVVHSVKPYGKVAGLDDEELENEELGDWPGTAGENGVERYGGMQRGRRRFKTQNFSDLEDDSSQYSSGNSGLNNYKSVGGRRNGGEVRNRGSRRSGNASGELDSSQGRFHRKLPGRNLSNTSKGRTSRIHDNGEGEARGFRNGRNPDSDINDSSFQSQINNSGRTLSSRSLSRTSRIHNSSDGETRGFRSGRNMDSETYDANFQSQVKHRGRTVSRTSTSRTRSIQNNSDGDTRGFQNTRSSGSEIYDRSFQSQIKHKGRTLSSRRDIRTSSRIQHDNGRRTMNRAGVNSGSSGSDVHDMSLQEDGTYGF